MTIRIVQTIVIIMLDATPTTPQAAPAPRTTTFVGKCKRCKVAARFRATVETRKVSLGYGRYDYVTRVAAPWGRAESSNGRVYATCLCGGRAEFSRIAGHKTDHKCGAKCRNSTSGICECSCGGENHGCSYGGLS